MEQREGTLEAMEMNQSFWQGKKVVVTGHTGFKGSWLSFWLSEKGAIVKGIALKPESAPNLFEVFQLEERIESVIGDICNYEYLRNELIAFEPDIIIHMAAKAIVRTSYEEPLDTLQTNVIGTANILQAARALESLRAVISVTSDKCYENKEWYWKYRESDPLGGWDPYSASKACAEIITESFRRSYFQEGNKYVESPGIATVRAGNVIGGGDWSKDRLIPDIVRALNRQQPVVVRNPLAIRPWQNILDLLNGYMMLAEKLYSHREQFSGPWNFGPAESDEQSVEYLVQKMLKKWGNGGSWKQDESANPHEANYLKLDSSKARTMLGWKNLYTVEESLDMVTEWYKQYFCGREMSLYSAGIIKSYEKQLSLNSMTPAE